MKLNKRQTAFSMAFMLAAIILVADRLFVLPKGAEASSTETEGDSHSALLLEASNAPPSMSKTKQVTERLEKLCSSDRILNNSLPDAFTLSDSWLADVDPSGSLMGRTDKVAAFRGRYELLAVAESNGSKIAFINNHRVQIGQTLDGFTLIEVDDQSATFESNDVRFSIKMQKDR